MAMKHRVAVLGAGTIGSTVARLLSEEYFLFDVKVFDTNPESLAKTSSYTHLVDFDELLKPYDDIIDNFDTVVNCLPHLVVKDVAKWVIAAGLNYFDLTEDAESASWVKTYVLSHKSKVGVVMPQCGLAPGYASILANDLVKDMVNFDLHVKVGALPQNPKGQLGYAVNWSADGLVNEYLNRCEVIDNYVIREERGLDGRGRVMIDGVELEYFNTSGGVGTLIYSYQNDAKNVRYSTMRYPGHLDGILMLVDELGLRNKRDELENILKEGLAPDHNDVVYIHIDALDRKEVRRTVTKKFLPTFHHTAIAWTTAASVCSLVEMTRRGLIEPGLHRQEEISLEDFENNPFGMRFKD